MAISLVSIYFFLYLFEGCIWSTPLFSVTNLAAYRVFVVRVSYLWSKVTCSAIHNHTSPMSVSCLFGGYAGPTLLFSLINLVAYCGFVL